VRRPDFLFSLGGFNPHFVRLRACLRSRLRLDIGFGDSRASRAGICGYFRHPAVWGERRLYPPRDRSTCGWIEFDALFILSPMATSSISAYWH
jgi:hypothetical protein